MEGQEVTKPKKGRAKYEVIIVVVLIVVAVVAGLALSKMRGKVDNDRLLMSELEQMRSAITMYKMINKTNPPSLEGLVKQTYTFKPGDTPKPYLPNIKPGKNGKFIDPFGNPYKYDVAKGWVLSTTPKYANW